MTDADNGVAVEVSVRKGFQDLASVSGSVVFANVFFHG